MQQQSVNSPECTHKSSRHREHGDVIWFGEGPVVGGEGPGQRALPEGNDEVDTPKKSHRIVDLQIEDVPLQQTLIVVLDEDAAGWRASWVICWVEVLGGGDGKVGDELTLFFHKCIWVSMHIALLIHCRNLLFIFTRWFLFWPSVYYMFFYLALCLLCICSIAPLSEIHFSHVRHKYIFFIAFYSLLNTNPLQSTHLRVTVHGAIDGLTVTHRGVQSDHSVDWISWSGQISTYIRLREELMKWLIRALLTICMQAYCMHTVHQIKKDTKRWRPSRQRTPARGQRWSEGKAELTSCGWLPCKTSTRTSWGCAEAMQHVHSKTQTNLKIQLLLLFYFVFRNGNGCYFCIITHLLDSWMRAMAMRILVRKKMRVRRMIASATDIIITEEERRKMIICKEIKISTGSNAFPNTFYTHTIHTIPYCTSTPISLSFYVFVVHCNLSAHWKRCITHLERMKKTNVCHLDHDLQMWIQKEKALTW